MNSDKPLELMYKKSFFTKRHRLAWRAPIVCKAIADTIKFHTVIDIGCAIGDLVKGYQDLGKTAYGIEGSTEAKPYLVCQKGTVFFLDLRRPLDTPDQPTFFSRDACGKALYDLVTCLEVAEHIEPKYAEQLVLSLTKLSDKILISAAPPGQRGHHHVNCQPIQYWDVLFKRLGYQRKDQVAEAVKSHWVAYKDKPGIKAYEQNLHYYKADTQCYPE